MKSVKLVFHMLQSMFSLCSAPSFEIISVDFYTILGGFSMRSRSGSFSSTSVRQELEVEGMGRGGG